MKTQEILIIKHPNDKHLATIIVPHKMLGFSLTSNNYLKKMLNRLLNEPKQILTKIEQDLYINSPDAILKVNFNILSNKQLINISDFSIHNEDTMDKWLNEFNNVTSNLPKNTKYSHLIFNYKSE